MLVPRLKSKIHIVRVTDANVNYEGSIILCPRIMRAAGLYEWDAVFVNNVETGKHWETYVISGKHRDVCLNGAAAKHFNIGDRVHILQYHYTSDVEMPKLVYCNDKNEVV